MSADHPGCKYCLARHCEGCKKKGKTKDMTDLPGLHGKDRFARHCEWSKKKGKTKDMSADHPA